MYDECTLALDMLLSDMTFAEAFRQQCKNSYKKDGEVEIIPQSGVTNVHILGGKSESATTKKTK